MTDRFDMQALKPDELSPTLPKRPALGSGEAERCLTGGTALAAACNVKVLCHSHNVWGNEMNSLSGFL